MPKIYKHLKIVGAFALVIVIPNSPLFAQGKSNGSGVKYPTAFCASSSEKQPKGKLCVATHGDNATPTRIPGPIDESNGSRLHIEVGPLSPIESCSLTSVTSTPSAYTNQGSLVQLISMLLGTSLTPIPTTGASINYTQSIAEPEELKERTTLAQALQLSDIENDESEARKEVNAWIRRREDTLDVLDKYQELLTTDARLSNHVRAGIAHLANCLDEQVDVCRPQDRAITYQYKTDLEKLLAKINAEITNAASPAGRSDVQKLDQDKTELARLQSADKTLRAGDAGLQTVYAQVAKVNLHVHPQSLPEPPDTEDIGSGPAANPIIAFDANGRLFEDLTLRPSNDSDLTASVTCTSIIDNSTTFGPVPLSVHTGQPNLVFSVGPLLSFTPHQTLGIVPVYTTGSGCANSASPSSPTCTTYVAASTGRDPVQLIPFAFLTYFFGKGESVRFGVTGGVGFNPYPGVVGVDGFEGVTFQWKHHKIYVHVGIHDGRYEDIDPTSGIVLNNPLPPDFPTTSSLPTRTRFTFHPAIGVSYSF